MSLELDMGVENSVVNIKVLGIGGGGNNVVDRMIKAGIRGVEFVAVNTDKQHLGNTGATHKIQIGEKLTGGQGAGSNPEVGKLSAEESRSNIARVLENTHMVFIAAGMGGGTGTGAAPVVAEIARELGILTVGVVTKPFSFEGPRRMKQAEAGISELWGKVDSLVVIPNDRLECVVDQKITFMNAFAVADDVLCQAVQNISELINVTQFINLDFADVCSVMRDAGYAHMGVGRAAGRDKAIEAARMAIESPLLETSVSGAKGVLICINGSTDLEYGDAKAAAEFVQQSVHPDANIIFGVALDPAMQDEMKITVIATGLDESAPKPVAKAPEVAAPAAQPQAQPQPQAQTAQQEVPQQPEPEIDLRKELNLGGNSPFFANSDDEEDPFDEISKIFNKD